MKKKSKNQKNKKTYVLVLGMVLVVVLLLFVVRFIRNELQEKDTRKSLDALHSQLIDLGYSETAKFDRCGVDDSRKFDSRKVCGYGIEYEIAVDNEVALNNYDELIAFFSNQSEFEAEDDLYENEDVDETSKDTYSIFIDKKSKKDCSFGLGIFHSLSEPNKPELIFKISCSR